MWICFGGESNVSVVTFGSPLAMIPGHGSEQRLFYARMAARMTHLVHQFDIVPRLLGEHSLPELDGILGKHETGQALSQIRRQYRPCGCYVLLTSQPSTLGAVSDPTLLLAATPSLAYLPLALGDHSMGKYRDKVLAYAAGE